MAIATVIGLLVSPIGAAVTPTNVGCPPRQAFCFVQVETPGTGGIAQPGSSGGVAPAARTCVLQAFNEPVECFNATFGWWSNTIGCYYRLADPQPPAADPVWEGRFPSGAIYHSMCPRVPGTGGGLGWFAAPPDGFGAASVTPTELAQQAIDTMQLTGPAIGIAPRPGSTGLVGLPVWLWTEVSPTTWGPNSATASVPGLTVTATAQAKKIVWDMGDGATVTCTSPGTVYSKGKGGGSSPTCGHTYQDSSAGQPGDAYPLTATTTWEVTWTGGGTSGTLTVSRSSSTTIRIGELQVLVT